MFRYVENVFIKKIILFLSLFFIACNSSSQNVPKVIDNNVYFLDGKTIIQIGDIDKYHIFSKQNRFIHITQQRMPNYSEFKIIFYDFRGNKISESDALEGSYVFVFAEISERVLAGQRAILTLQNESFLYDLNGNLLNVLTHDYGSKQIGITEDEKYFWFAANKMRLLYPREEPLYHGMTHTPYNHIIIFDVYTGEFIKDYSTDESNFDFDVNGKNYSIIVGPPDVPG
jgi:hypothetical protein